MKLLIILSIFMLGCASDQARKQESKKAKIKRHLKALKTVRPLLKSDEFAFMKCRGLGQAQAEFEASYDSIHNQNFGVIELREEALLRKANIMTLSHQVRNDRAVYKAELYRCENVTDVTSVEVAGMCASSKELVVTLDYPDDETRAVGEEMVRQKARYYAIENYYKTYHVKKIKYSYTKKQFNAQAIFYKCL